MNNCKNEKTDGKKIKVFHISVAAIVDRFYDIFFTKQLDAGIDIKGVRKIRSELLDEFYFVSDIDEVLRKSDIVILTLLLTDRTKHFINKDRISNMKNKCVLVNVSRGEIIDEEALLDAIRNDRFLGVALDVFEQEPLSKENPLWDMERVIITPHNSFISDKIYDRLFKIIYNNLQEFIVKDRCISNE